MTTLNSEVSMIYLNEKLGQNLLFCVLTLEGNVIINSQNVIYRVMERKYKKQKLVYEISVGENNRIANGKKGQWSPMLNVRGCS